MFIYQERKRACSDNDRFFKLPAGVREYARAFDQAPRNAFSKLENMGVRNKFSDGYMGRK